MPESLSTPACFNFRMPEPLSDVYQLATPKQRMSESSEKVQILPVDACERGRERHRNAFTLHQRYAAKKLAETIGLPHPRANGLLRYQGKQWKVP